MPLLLTLCCGYLDSQTDRKPCHPPIPFIRHPPPPSRYELQMSRRYPPPPPTQGAPPLQDLVAICGLNQVDTYLSPPPTLSIHTAQQHTVYSSRQN